MSMEDASGSPHEDGDAQASKDQEEEEQSAKQRAEDLKSLEDAESTVVSSFKDFEEELLQALPE